mgnify:FL=1
MKSFARFDLQRMLSVPVLAGLLVGCNQPPAVNPWQDDSISRDARSTPTQDGILEAGHEPALRQRDIAPSTHQTHHEVPHYPLWWEDPFEDKGDQNDTFAWTWQDYVVMPYSVGRFALNGLAWPISAIVTSPGTPLISDGVPGRDHDARPGKSPNPQSDPGDFGQRVAAAESPADDDAVEADPHSH